MYVVSELGSISLWVGQYVTANEVFHHLYNIEQHIMKITCDLGFTCVEDTKFPHSYNTVFMRIIQSPVATDMRLCAGAQSSTVVTCAL